MLVKIGVIRRTLLSLCFFAAAACGTGTTAFVDKETRIPLENSGSLDQFDPREESSEKSTDDRNDIDDLDALIIVVDEPSEWPTPSEGQTLDPQGEEQSLEDDSSTTETLPQSNGKVNRDDDQPPADEVQNQGNDEVQNQGNDEVQNQGNDEVQNQGDDDQPPASEDPIQDDQETAQEALDKCKAHLDSDYVHIASSLNRVTLTDSDLAFLKVTGNQNIVTYNMMSEGNLNAGLCLFVSGNKQVVTLDVSNLNLTDVIVIIRGNINTVNINLSDNAQISHLVEDLGGNQPVLNISSNP